MDYDQKTIEQLARNLASAKKFTGVSKCMFCGSPQYGLSCPYAPHGLHVHVDDAHKCIFCGSTAAGLGCRLNPGKRKIHIRGAFMASLMESLIKNGVQMTLLMNALKEPFTNKQAYKLGLINEEGERIRKPITLEEKAALGLYESLIFKIKRLLGPKIDLIHEMLQIESSKPEEQESIEDFQRNCEMEAALSARIEIPAREIEKLIHEFTLKGLPTEKIQKILIEKLAVNID